MKIVLWCWCLLVLLLNADALAKTPWEKIKEPIKSGQSKSLGNYNLGCVISAEELPLDGYGYKVMRPYRNRNYGNLEIIDYIKNLAKNTKEQLTSTLIVGDIGLPAGGEFSYGHRSHQIGLDADFWFVTPKQANFRKLINSERNKISAISVVDMKNKIVNKNFSDYHVQLLKLATKSEKVDRIFVNFAIKKYLCENNKGQSWIKKIRPWYGHNYHFHVRLKCPKNSPKCTLPENYEPIKNEACDETLDWWFKERTPQEIAEWKEKEAKAKLLPKPKPPAECLDLIGPTTH